jgi:hypothetical protein
MRRAWTRIIVALLGLVSLAEVGRMVFYGLPESAIFTVGWSLAAGLLLLILGALRSDRRMRWCAALPILAFALAAALAGLAGARRWEWLMTFSIALALALPVTTVALVGLRLNPGIGAPLRRIPAPAGLVVAVIATVAATPPAWDAVTFVAITETDSVRREFLAAHMGCYQVTVDGWSPRGQPGHSIITPPRFIRLDTVRGEPFQPDVRSPANIREQGVPVIRPGWLWGGAVWKPIDDRRVVLTWSTGFNGTRAVLMKTSGGYRGRASSWTDVGSGFRSPRATVHAVPASCDSVPVDSARQPGALQREMDRMYSKHIR